MMRFIIGQWPQTTNAGSHRRISSAQSCTIAGMNASLVGILPAILIMEEKGTPGEGTKCHKDLKAGFEVFVG